jgi:cob(I)alamin adenosyltransferase
MMEDLAGVVDQVGMMQQVDPDVKFISMFIKPEVFADSTVRREAEPLAKYEYILKAYFSVADELRSIRKINLDQYDEEGVRFITEVIAELTKAFEDLGVIVSFFAAVKAAQMLVFKVQLQYLNRYASLLYLHARDNAIHEGTKQAVEKTFTDLEKKLKSYGL